ncbi:MAG: hypothetical protein JRI54_12180, partial [Deltaproteobacteria bacterium]|nr:hypothetical protein [Deltaproteobacteria bacterium]
MSSLLHKLMTSKPTPRVNKLRDTYLSAKPSIRIDVDRIIARVMKETERAPMVLRRAGSFAAVVREIPINIFPDELF